jgi:putative DNA primase/helicase
MLFLYVDGSNGKSVFSNILQRVLGELSIPAPQKLLTMSDRHPTEIACLCSKRLVVANETSKGMVLDEALVKVLTSTEPITSRFVHKDNFQFKPTHKLIVVGNHRPVVKGDDEGIWRKVKVVPFKVTIPEAKLDPRFAERFDDELPGILNWAIEGGKLYLMEGLREPAEVKSATQEYREESGGCLRKFLELECVFKPSLKSEKQCLRMAYEKACSQEGEPPASHQEMSAALRRRGVKEISIRTLE